jgi:atypical dual specificity phosphatase
MNFWIKRTAAAVMFYPSLVYNLTMVYVLKRWRWWNRVDEHVLIGARPSAATAEELAAEGVQAVVNTCEEYAGPVDAYKKLGIEQLHIPTVDFTPPQLENVIRGVAFVEESIAAGKQVYVHCKAGRARSVTIVLCWLIKTQGMTPAEAQKFLEQQRPQTLKSVYKRSVVGQYVEWLKQQA